MMSKLVTHLVAQAHEDSIKGAFGGRLLTRASDSYNPRRYPYTFRPGSVYFYAGTGDTYEIRDPEAPVHPVNLPAWRKATTSEERSTFPGERESHRSAIGIALWYLASFTLIETTPEIRVCIRGSRASGIHWELAYESERSPQSAYEHEALLQKWFQAIDPETMEAREVADWTQVVRVADMAPGATVAAEKIAGIAFERTGVRYPIHRRG